MASKPKLKLGVLVSGSGTNLQAIIDACESGRIRASVCVVISDTPDAYAFKRAKKHKIAAEIIERKSFNSEVEFENTIAASLKKHEIELVCLAGFMRIIHAPLLNSFPNRIINIHPALLPSFPGLDAQKQAFDYGVKVSGCTVHFVDDKTDHGPIISQTAVPVNEGDTANDLKERILKEEHRLFPAAIQLIAEGKIRIDGRRVKIMGG